MSVAEPRGAETPMSAALDLGLCFRGPSTGALDHGSGRFQMWEMLRFRWLPGILLAVLVVASPANGSVVQALELQELVAHADRIVLGRVLFSESFRSPNGQLGTWHRIAVERELRGSVPDEQEVIGEQTAGGVNE